MGHGTNAAIALLAKLRITAMLTAWFKRLETLFVAVTFAEAGEFETAREIAFPDAEPAEVETAHKIAFAQ